MDQRSTSLTSHGSTHRARERGVSGEGTDVPKASRAAAGSRAHTEVADKTGSQATGPCDSFVCRNPITIFVCHMVGLSSFQTRSQLFLWDLRRNEVKEKRMFIWIFAAAFAQSVVRIRLYELEPQSVEGGKGSPREGAF